MASTGGNPQRNARDIFLSALDVPIAARATFLDNACAGDVRLRAEVDALLDEQEQLGDFLQAPAFHDSGSSLGIGIARVTAGVMEKQGDRIDRYKLLQKIGEGGCGVVYMAEQEQPVRRRVALKIIKLGMDTKSVIARFEAERQALAMMDHPNIARVLDAGATDTGRPYFVMELVRGVRITDYCDENALTTEDRLKLFTQVCNAIQHAHQKGIIHRDIKPSNILVTLHDGVPVPKVIDFGISKATEQPLTDKTVFTEFHSFIGTPAYMSPEQAQMSGLDIDTRSDIYSLGVLLYELLTGRPPFDPSELTRSGLDECRRTIREQDPARPSTRVSSLPGPDRTKVAGMRRTDAGRLVHTLRGDLDWIVMKCLEKDRTRRYGTASDLAADVQRYIQGAAILARPPSNVYLVGKFLHRHQFAVGAGAALALTLLIGAGLSTWQAYRATRAEHAAENAQKEESRLRGNAEHERLRAEQESAAARLNEYVADINLAQQSLAGPSPGINPAGNLGRALQLLQKHRPLTGMADLRGFEWRYLWQLTRGDEHISFPIQEGGVTSVAFSPSGDLIVAGLGDRFNAWSVSRRTLVVSKKRPQAPGFSFGGGLGGGQTTVTFLPDGRLLSCDGTLRLWRTDTWTEEKTINGIWGPLSVSRDGSRVAVLFRESGFREGIRILNTTTWTNERTIREASAPLAMSADGRMLASLSRTNGGLMVWRLDGEQAPVSLADSTNLFPGAGGPFRSGAIAFSPDGRQVLASRNVPSDRGVFVLSVWDATTGKELAALPTDPEHIEHTGGISSIAFSPDGTTLATASMDHTIRVWDFEKRQRVATLQGHLNEVWAIAFSPDSRLLLSGGKSGGLKLWPAHPIQKDELIAEARLPIGFSADGRTLAALSRSNIVFFDATSAEKEEEIVLDNGRPQGPGGGRPSRGFRPGPPAATAVAASADLATIAAVVRDGRVQIWQRDTGETTVLTNNTGPVQAVAVSRDGRMLVTSAFGRSRCWYLPAQTNVTIEGVGDHPLFSPDARTIAFFGGRESHVQLWDTFSRTTRTNLALESGPPAMISAPPGAFSPDSRTLAVVCQDDTVRLFDVQSLRPIGTLSGHKQTIHTVTFAPDGRTIATGSDDSTVKFWNVATQQELLTLRRLGGAPRGLIFSPDGQMLVVGASSTLPTSSLRVFRAPSLEEIDRLEAQIAAKNLQ